MLRNRMRRLHTRVFALVLLVAVLSALASGWLVYRRMLASFRSVDTTAMLNRADVYDELSIGPLYTGSLDGLEDQVKRAADASSQRIVLTDQDRKVILDSQPGRPVPKRSDFAVVVPESRRNDVDPALSASCFRAAGLPDLTTLPSRFSSFPSLVDALQVANPTGDEFDQAVADLNAGESEDLTRCLSANFAYDGPVGLVFIGNGELERFRLGSPLPWITFGASALAIGSLVALFIARRVTKPLSALTVAADRVSHGSLGDRIDVEGSQEVNDLRESFNEMAARLQETETRRSQLLRDLTHELRNPLGVLQAQIEAAIDGVVPMDQQSLDVMHQEVGQLSSLVNDLQLLDGYESGAVSITSTRVKLHEIAESVLENNRLAYPRHRFDAKLIDVAVSGDPVRLRQLISNLVRNAVQHTDEGGTISVSVNDLGHAVVLAVTDTGVGIPQDQLASVFDRFWRGDPSRRRDTADRGAGLGLSICRAIADAHKASISVHSREGAGTTFTVTLPRFADA